VRGNFVYLLAKRSGSSHPEILTTILQQITVGTMLGGDSHTGLPARQHGLASYVYGCERTFHVIF